MKKLLKVTLLSSALLLALAGCGEDKSANNNVLTIGATPVPHADILAFAQPLLKKEGVELKVIEFSDYVKPNLSLADKELDANFFQHLPYLDEFKNARSLKLTSLVAVHIEPMGVYSRQLKNVNELKVGAKVAIPNDPTNGGRALKILEKAGLITLDPNATLLASVADIVKNDKELKIIEVESAQLPRSLDDVALAVINSNYALGANLNPVKDALAIESKDSPYANIVAIREGDNRESLAKLKAVLTSPEMKAFLEKTYEGAVVPAF